MSGYGCQCDDNECLFGIEYNAREKTISFYKNGYNQGVAFSNVPQGLTPSLDLWFETGYVSIT